MLFSFISIPYTSLQAAQVPDAPFIFSPGLPYEPGLEISTLTPTLYWTEVPEAAYYALAISKYPYGPGNVIYNPQYITGTSHTVPSGVLQSGEKYRWNMQAGNAAGWGPISNTLYFQTPGTVNARIDNWSVTPSYVSSGQSVTLSMTFTNTGTASYTFLAGASLWAPDGTIIDFERYVTLSPGSSTNVSWSRTLYMVGSWDVQFAVWRGKPFTAENLLHKQPPTKAVGYISVVEAGQVPSAPTALSPGSASGPGPEISTLTPTLSWTAVSGADRYALAISKYPYGTANIIYNPQNLTGTSHTVPSRILEPGERYRWNMQAGNAAGWSEISNTLYFQTQETQLQIPSAPTAVSPGSESAPGPIISTLRPILTWERVFEADRYALAISKYPYGPENVIFSRENLSGYTQSFEVPSYILQPGEKYRWNMQAGNAAGWSSMSNTLYFQTWNVEEEEIELFVDIYAHEDWDIGLDGAIFDVDLIIYIETDTGDQDVHWESVHGVVTNQDGYASIGFYYLKHPELIEKEHFILVSVFARTPPGGYKLADKYSDSIGEFLSEHDLEDLFHFHLYFDFEYVPLETEPSGAGRIKLIEPLALTHGPYIVEDTLTANFTIKNDGDATITLDKLLLGGRFNGGELPDGGYPDFTDESVTLQPGETHAYEGTLTLPEAGEYEFFIAYYIENPTEAEKEFLDENNWNTAIELGEGLTDADRIRQITVGPPLGTHRVAYIPVKFSGGPEPIRAVEDLKVRAELVEDYYRQQSFGQVELRSIFISNEWISLDKTLAEYIAQAEELLLLPKWETWKLDHIIFWLIKLDAIEKGNQIDEKLDLESFVTDCKDRYYDAGFVIHPCVKSELEVQNVPDGVALTSASLVAVNDKASYGTWAHELGHAIFKWHDYYLRDGSRGDVRYWCLMGSGSSLYATAPIMVYLKEKVGWLQYKNMLPYKCNIPLTGDLGYGDIICRYRAWGSSDLLYYIFEGRKPPDNSTVIDPWHSRRHHFAPISLSGEEGVMLYSVSIQNGEEHVHAVPSVYHRAFSVLNETFMRDRVTLLPGESYLCVLTGVEFKALKENNQLAIEADSFLRDNIDVYYVSNSQYKIGETGRIAVAPLLTEYYFDVDIQVYTIDGRKVGMDYDNWEYIMEIDGARTSGNVPGGGPEWISVPMTEEVYFTINATSAKRWAEELGIHDLQITTDVKVIFFDDAGERTETEPITVPVSLDEPTNYMVKGEEIVLMADVRIAPEVINLRSSGEWITAYIELQEPYSVHDVNIENVTLEYAGEQLAAEWGDVQDENILMVKFDYLSVASILEVGEDLEISIAGEVNGISFKGTDFVRVISPGQRGN